jgi:Pyruvate/2-oxoacid:ferredoxin oxidoreductase gamma subunit
MLALKTMFEPADGFRAHLEVRFGEHHYDVRVDDELQIVRGSADRPDTMIATDPATLATVLWHNGDAESVIVDGDREVFRRFQDLFRRT